MVIEEQKESNYKKNPNKYDFIEQTINTKKTL